MSTSFKRTQLSIAALVSVPILIFLAWGGLTLPFDFQPDPNYSHVLNGLHIADTGRFDNTFYPGVVNFYLMALFDLVSGVALPSSELFGIASVEKATYIARSAQITITLLTTWAWMYAFSTLIYFRKMSYREHFAYSIALFSTLCFMVFSYAFIYQAYFLRPDNSLSLCLALGLALFSKIRNIAVNNSPLKQSYLFYVGIWVFFMTATKSQGQVYIGIGVLYVLCIGISNKINIIKSNNATKISRGILVISIIGSLIVAVNGIDILSVENKYFDFFIIIFLMTILLISLMTDVFFAMAALYISAGWCISLIFIYFLTNGQFQSVLEIANPIHSFIVQVKYSNLSISAAPLLFHIKHIGIYGLIPMFFCIVGVAFLRRRVIFLLMGLGTLMILTVSLRLPGYYNAILFMPFFCIAAGLSIYYFFIERFNKYGYLVVMLLIGIHVALNVSLHSSHITALHAACLSRGSLVGVRYDPDTVNIKYTMRNEGWTEYSKHYFTVITNFDYWPTIRDKLKNDKKFQELLQGTLTTCTPE